MNHTRRYVLLLLMFAAHVLIMYVLMFAMVDAPANAYPNRSQLYMAFLMAAPMVTLELLLMRSHYPNQGLNSLFIIISIAILGGSFFLIRSQYAVGDEELLRSMIPHHAGAILMCGEATLKDDQVIELCNNIMVGQQAEIDWMKAKLQSLRD